MSDDAVTDTCTFRRDPRGFVHAVMRKGCQMQLADAQKNIAAIATLTHHTRMPVLVDLRGVRSQSREARDYFGGPEAAETSLAVALLIGSPVSRVLANFFLRLNSTRYPTRLFTDEAGAINWLIGHIP